MDTRLVGRKGRRVEKCDGEGRLTEAVRTKGDGGRKAGDWGWKEKAAKS